MDNLAVSRYWILHAIHTSTPPQRRTPSLQLYARAKPRQLALGPSTLAQARPGFQGSRAPGFQGPQGDPPLCFCYRLTGATCIKQLFFLFTFFSLCSTSGPSLWKCHSPRRHIILCTRMDSAIDSHFTMLIISALRNTMTSPEEGF